MSQETNTSVTPPNPPDELIARLREPATARQAFGEVIKLYTKPLYWQIRRMVNSHDDANDLLQNTFLKAWTSLENFRGEARLSTWLYKIAVNESLSFLERERKRLNISIDDEEAHILHTIEADTNIDGNNLALELRKAIAALPEKQRLVFNMRYYDDMKYEDMSQILGTSVGALKTSYHLAVKKIEAHFKDIE
ncbi:MAG: RNA polymerase sigma factor [Paramuribaculum sp.]|nr:RNA polymerase sigma factor [Paramuribaculum sp.]MDE6304774.1 RNA polymerase sigma factor [Paramuribaculum sp.]